MTTSSAACSATGAVRPSRSEGSRASRRCPSGRRRHKTDLVPSCRPSPLPACPGLTFVYAHTNILISAAADKEYVDMLLSCFIGAPILPNLCLPRCCAASSSSPVPATARPRRAGLKALIRAFSFPGGFPSHVNAETPGAIHEGGELGYALAVAYGSVRASSFALIRISPNRLAPV
jgi:hypothetical protein